MTMRDVHKAYQRRIERGEIIQAWCIAGGGLSRAKAPDQIKLWRQRVEACKARVNRRRAA